MWTQTRPNGQAIEAGTFCWVTEIEGTNPIYTYGKTMEEVIAKLDRTASTAQAALARRAQQPARSTAPKPVVFGEEHAVEIPPRLSPDEVMRATQDLDNPSRAGSAVRRLVEDETGLDFNELALDKFATVGITWQRNHPEYYPHPANQRLMATLAFSYVGNRPALVRAEHMTQAYEELAARGELVDAPPADNNNPNPNPSSTSFPGGSQSSARTTERPRGAQRHATGARSTSFSGARPSQTPTVKYTAEQIRTMPDSKARALIQGNDPDYAAACEFHFGSAQSA